MQQLPPDDQFYAVSASGRRDRTKRRKTRRTAPTPPKHQQPQESPQEPRLPSSTVEALSCYSMNGSHDNHTNDEDDDDTDEYGFPRRKTNEQQRAVTAISAANVRRPPSPTCVRDERILHTKYDIIDHVISSRTTTERMIHACPLISDAAYVDEVNAVVPQHNFHWDSCCKLPRGIVYLVRPSADARMLAYMSDICAGVSTFLLNSPERVDEQLRQLRPDDIARRMDAFKRSIYDFSKVCLRDAVQTLRRSGKCTTDEQLLVETLASLGERSCCVSLTASQGGGSCIEYRIFVKGYNALASHMLINTLHDLGRSHSVLDLFRSTHYRAAQDYSTLTRRRLAYLFARAFGLDGYLVAENRYFQTNEKLAVPLATCSTDAHYNVIYRVNENNVAVYDDCFCMATSDFMVVSQGASHGWTVGFVNPVRHGDNDWMVRGSGYRASHSTRTLFTQPAHNACFSVDNLTSGATTCSRTNVRITGRVDFGSLPTRVRRERDDEGVAVRYGGMPVVAHTRGEMFHPSRTRANAYTQLRHSGRIDREQAIREEFVNGQSDQVFLAMYQGADRSDVGHWAAWAGKKAYVSGDANSLITTFKPDFGVNELLVRHYSTCIAMISSVDQRRPPPALVARIMLEQSQRDSTPEALAVASYWSSVFAGAWGGELTTFEDAYISLSAEKHEQLIAAVALWFIRYSAIAAQPPDPCATLAGGGRTFCLANVMRITEPYRNVKVCQLRLKYIAQIVRFYAYTRDPVLSREFASPATVPSERVVQHIHTAFGSLYHTPCTDLRISDKYLLSIR